MSFSVRRPSWIPWLTFALALWTAGFAWAITGPPFAVADEPAHFIKGAAVWRGQLSADPGPERIGELVEVPKQVAYSAALAGCVADAPNKPACAAHLRGGHETVQATTQVGEYPPMFYVLTGWPTMLALSDVSLYAGRLVSTTATTALLVAATWALAQLVGRRTAMAGMLVAATPMVVYLGAALNPSGMEAAAGIAVWCFGLLALRRLADQAPVTVPVAVGWTLAASVLAAARWTGPILLGAIMFAVLLTQPLGSLPDLCRGAWRDRPLRWSIAGSLVVVALSTAFIATRPRLLLLPGFMPPAEQGSGAILVGETPLYLTQMIASMGWLEVPPPTFTLLAWAMLLGTLIGAAVLVDDRRLLRAMALAAVVVVAAPFTTIGNLEEMGLHFQGRYMLAVAAGIPILALVAIADGERAGRLRAERLPFLLAPVAAVGHVVAFVWAQRRYAVGADGPLSYLTDAEWSPPGGNGVLLAVFALAMVLATLAATVSRRAPAPPA